MPEPMLIVADFKGGRHLYNTSSWGAQSPYCRCWSSSTRNEKFTTRTCEGGGSSAVWNDTANVHVKDSGEEYFYLEVKARSMMTDPLIGRLKIACNEIPKTETEMSLKIYTEKGTEGGEVHLKVVMKTVREAERENASKFNTSAAPAPVQPHGSDGMSKTVYQAVARPAPAAPAPASPAPAPAPSTAYHAYGEATYHAPAPAPTKATYHAQAPASSPATTAYAGHSAVRRPSSQTTYNTNVAAPPMPTSALRRPSGPATYNTNVSAPPMPHSTYAPAPAPAPAPRLASVPHSQGSFGGSSSG